MRSSFHRQFWFLLVAALLAITGLLATGCKSTEAENVSSRPWNSTEGWQSGFPSTLNEGR